MKNGDQPAFPTEHENQDGSRQPITGMTKRELFAAMAMQGICANPNVKNDGKSDTAQFYAYAAIKFTDELLKQLES